MFAHDQCRCRTVYIKTLVLGFRILKLKHECCLTNTKRELLQERLDKAAFRFWWPKMLEFDVRVVNINSADCLHCGTKSLCVHATSRTVELAVHAVCIRLTVFDTETRFYLGVAMAAAAM